MKVIFKNPAKGTLEVGFVVKKTYSSKGVRYTLINELGSIFSHLPAKDFFIKGVHRGYVDLELTETIIPHIKTNLNLNTQGNYKNPLTPEGLAVKKYDY